MRRRLIQGDRTCLRMKFLDVSLHLVWDELGPLGNRFQELAYTFGETKRVFDVALGFLIRQAPQSAV
jgi:hypothetical protein